MLGYNISVPRIRFRKRRPKYELWECQAQYDQSTSSYDCLDSLLRIRDAPP